MESQSSNTSPPPPTRRAKPVGTGSLAGTFFFFGIFAAIGLGLLYLSYYFAEDSREFLERGVRVQGEVVELHFSRDSEGDGTYRPEVKYLTPEGVEYRFISSNGSNPASFDRGEQVQILYLPENPQDGRIEAFFSLWGGTLICGVMGVIFALVGLGAMWGGIRTHNRRLWLARHGRRMAVQVSHVMPPEGKRSYYTLVAQWQNPADNKMYLFTSDPVYFDPTDYLKETVEVVINPANPAQYVMDTGFLPEVAQ